MKLTKEHLSPYLPYRLKGIITNKIHKGWLSEGSKIELSIAHFNSFDGYKIKPILRPLSDLTLDNFKDLYGENISVNTLSDRFIIYIMDRYEEVLFIKDTLILDRGMLIGVKIYNYLIKNHFDVFNLIPQGLAIDINTI